MKALTLTQPWASLVAVGAKRIETRSWPTNYRGPLAIHAAKGFGGGGGKRACENLCHLEPFRSALLPAGRRSGGTRIFSFDMLPVGAIVAVVELVDVVPTERAIFAMKVVGLDMADEVEREATFGNYAPTRYAWLLSNVRALDEPIDCRGALGLWEVPADLLTLTESLA